MNSIVTYIVLPYTLNVVKGPKQAQGSPGTHQMHAHLISKQATFLKALYQRSHFITGEQMWGYFHKTHGESSSQSFFLHLSDLLEQRISKSLSLHLLPYTTTQHLYNSLIPAVHQCPKTSKMATKHQNSHSGTDHYWGGTCTIIHHPLQTLVMNMLVCSEEDMYSNFPSPESSGWLHNTNRTHAIDWEDPEIEDRISGTVIFLIKGCTCKKGCSSNKCRATRREATEALGVSAKGVWTYLCSSQ